MHRVPWKTDGKFSNILDRYVEYLNRNFGTYNIVVFHVYSANSIKTV